MNWYKLAQKELRRIEDRNNFNDRLRDMEDTVAVLTSMVQGIHEDPYRSKQVISEVAANKFFSSFPNWRELLHAANLKVLDNHNAASEMVAEVATALLDTIHSMKKQRDEFLTKEYPINFKEKMDMARDRARS